MPKALRTTATGRISIHHASRRRVLPNRLRPKGVGRPDIGTPPSGCRVARKGKFANEISRATVASSRRRTETHLWGGGKHATGDPIRASSIKVTNLAPGTELDTYRTMGQPSSPVLKLAFMPVVLSSAGAYPQR